MMIPIYTEHYAGGPPVTSQYTNPSPVENRGTALAYVAAILLTCGLGSFLLRVYVRTFVVESFGMDDWLMTAAMVVFVFYISCVLAGVHYGTGRHFADLSASDATQAMEVGSCVLQTLYHFSRSLFLGG